MIFFQALDARKLELTKHWSIAHSYSLVLIVTGLDWCVCVCVCACMREREREYVCMLLGIKPNQPLKPYL